MADKKFDLVFNASLEVGQVKSAIASLTKSLENAGAKIPQSMATNLNRMIQSLSTELNKLEGITDIQLDPKNAKNVGKSYEKIFQTFQQIKVALGDIHRTAGIDPEKFFPSEIASNIAKATQAVQKYKKAMETGVKTDEHTKATKDIADAEKKVKSLNDKLDEAARKRQSSSIVKDQLQETRKKLQAEKDQAEAEDKAAKEAQKAIQDRIKSQERLAQVEEEIAKKKKKQQEAVNKAAKANEIKNERESMKQAKGKGTDTKIYRDAVASYAESTAEVQKLQGEIDQLQAEYAQLSQAATVTADEIAAANDRATKATTELANAQKRLNKNQSDIDAADTKYAAATAEVKTLVPEVQKAEDALNQLIQKKEQLESSFEQSIFDELIQELGKLGIQLPDTERSMEGVERALDELANKARGEVVSALQGVEKAVEDVETPLKQTGQAADNFDQMADSARHAEQDMENLKNQVLDFFSITNTIQIFKNAIRDAFDTVKELDAAMTETAVVTDFSVGDMWEKLPQYSAEATKLGASIKSLYKATTLYYQQGLNSEQAMGVGIETMKMARIANMDAAAATEAMTAALRGFNMEINEMSATRINDVYSELAAITAADTSQIATAMSKTASIAESANMEFETTAALLAQIIETTQEAPETAGTAMKTIIARFTEVKQLFSEGMLTGEDSEGEEININKIDAALKTVGISLKDFLTGAKGIDDIFLELASKWDTLDLATQRYIATTAAGSRQQSRFLAMMGNYDRTMELVNAATNSAGASQKQFGKTLDSLDAKLQKLKNALDTFTMGLANSEIVKGGVDLLTWILETVNKLTEAFDGIGGSVAKIGLAIAALRTGKGLFNLFTGQAYSAGTQAGAKFAAGLVASIKDIPIDQATTNLQNNLKGALSSTVAWSNGLLALGMGLKFVAQQLEDTPLEKYTGLVSGAGTAVLAFSGALKILTPIAAAANKTVWQLISSVIVGIGPIGWAVAAIVALGGALAYIGYQNTPEQVLKRTQKYAEEAGEAAEEAAQKYSELQSSLNALSNSETALEGMTVGTQEWRDAVVALNDEVLRLIEMYPDLGELVGFKNGHLTIDYESDRGQEVQRQLQNQVVASQIASIAAKAAVTKQEEQTYYYDNIYGFNPLVSQQGKIEELAKAIFNNPQMNVANSEEAQQQIIDWLNNNNLKQFAQDEITVGRLVENRQSLYDYGKYLNENQRRIQSYDTMTQSSLISNMDTDKYNERVLALLSKIQVPVQESADEWAENNEINKSNFVKYDKEYAESLFGVGAQASINHWNNKVTLSSADGKETRTLDYEEFKAEVAYQEGAKLASNQLTEAANLIAKMSSEQQTTLEKVLSSEGSQLDLATLRDIDLSGGIQQYISKTFGKDVVDKFESVFGLTFDQLEDNTRIASERINKERATLAKRMAKYSSTSHFQDADNNLNILAGLEDTENGFGAKLGAETQAIFNEALDSLELTFDTDLVTTGFEQLRDVAIAGTREEVLEISDLIGRISWNDPIESVYQLNKELKTGTDLTKTFANNILNSGADFVGPASQLKALFQSEEYKDISEDIAEILQTQDKLTDSDVRDLASEYSYLNKMLKNTGMTAEALAIVLNKIREEDGAFDGLTDAVLNSIKNMDTLENAMEKVLQKIKDFDLGMDQGEVQDTFDNWGELVKEKIEGGEFGNEQLHSVFKNIFGNDYLGGAVGDEAINARLKELGTIYNNLFTDNGLKAMLQASEGLDLFGNAITATKDELQALKDQGFVLEQINGSLVFEVPDDWTLEQSAQQLSEIYGGTVDVWEMLVTLFSNYSHEMRRTWDEADFNRNAGKDLVAESVQVGGKTLVTDKEISDSASLWDEYLSDKDFNEVKATLESQIKELNETGEVEIEILTLYNGEELKTADEIMAELNRVFEGDFTKQFVIEGSIGTIDYSGIMSAVNSLPIPEELANQVVNGLIAGTAKVGDIIQATIDGEPIEVTVDSALLESGDFVGAVQAELQAAQEAADDVTITGTAEITVNESLWRNSLSVVTNGIAGIKGKSVPITTYLNDQTGLKNNSTSNTTGPKPGSLDWELTYNADGEPGAIKKYDSLIGEEGPELVEGKDGAFLGGVGGPQVTTLQRGDKVHTAKETEEIFKRKGVPIPAYKGGAVSVGTIKGSGGTNVSSKSDDDKEDWENPFDKLYNLVREIDEELRRRERLERRYEKLLESVDLTAGKLFDNAVEQLKQLEKEKLLNKELQEARRSQIQQYQQENADLMKYAKIVQNERGEDVLRIHWDQINLVEDPEQGQRIEDYVSQLEEWMDGLNDIEDELNDIEDRIEEVKELGKDEYLDLENAIKDAVAFAYQEEIDKLSEINESINDTNTQLIDAISKQVNRIRQQRENENTERELQEKQRRLQYLQQDTSGANAMEILQLQKEIAEGQQDYTDTLIDQKISELQEQNDEAATQREQQITLMQAQLDHLIQSGEIWDEVYALMDEGLDPEAGLVRGSRLEQLLKSADGFDGMSKVQQMDWLKELQQQAAQAVTYMRLTTEKLDTSIELNRQNYFGATTPEPEYNGSSSSGGGGSSGGSSSGSSGGGSGYNNSGYSADVVRQAQSFVGTAVDGMWGANSQAAAAAKGYNSLAEVIAAMNAPVYTWKISTPGGQYITTFTGTQAQVDASFPSNSYKREKTTSSSSTSSGSTNSGSSSSGATSNNSSSNNSTTTTTKYTKVKVTYANGKVVTYDYNSDWRSLAEYWKSSYGGYYTYTAYKTGGLADFTGPAWLDGTKSRPELVLNARDTQNFIQLKDILASVMDRGGSSNTSTENNGDITYDIDINVESIGSDYDVEQVANKVKSMIGENARYRNNNTVSLAR